MGQQAAIISVSMPLIMETHSDIVYARAVGQLNFNLFYPGKLVKNY